MKRLCNVFHTSLSYPAKNMYNRPLEQCPPPLTLDREDNYYEVEDILDAKHQKGK